MKIAALEQNRLGEPAVSKVDRKIDIACAQVQLPGNQRVADPQAEPAHLIGSLDEDVSYGGGGESCDPARYGCTIQHGVPSRCRDQGIVDSPTARVERQVVSSGWSMCALQLRIWRTADDRLDAPRGGNCTRRTTDRESTTSIKLRGGATAPAGRSGVR